MTECFRIEYYSIQKNAFRENVNRRVFVDIPVDARGNSGYAVDGILVGNERDGYAVRELGKNGLPKPGLPWWLNEDAWVYNDVERLELIGIVHVRAPETDTN